MTSDEYYEKRDEVMDMKASQTVSLWNHGMAIDEIAEKLGMDIRVVEEIVESDVYY